MSKKNNHSEILTRNYRYQDWLELLDDLGALQSAGELPPASSAALKILQRIDSICGMNSLLPEEKMESIWRQLKLYARPPKTHKRDEAIAHIIHSYLDDLESSENEDTYALDEAIDFISTHFSLEESLVREAYQNYLNNHRDFEDVSCDYWYRQLTHECDEYSKHLTQYEKALRRFKHPP